jgi:hypothetical protein
MIIFAMLKFSIILSIFTDKYYEKQSKNLLLYCFLQIPTLRISCVM